MGPRAVTPMGRPFRRPGRRFAAALVVVVGGASILGVGFVRGMGIGAAAGPPSASASGAIAVASRPVTPEPIGSAQTGGSPTPSTPSTSSTPPGSSPPGTSPPPSVTPQTRATLAGPALQSELDRVRRKLGIPGVSVTIVFEDGSAWTGVSGLADVATGTPVAPDTAFAIASVSKTFTSALILQLVDEGRLHLGDSAASLLPAVPLKLDRRITVAMLLDHTSGLADYFLNPKIDGPLQKRPTVAWSAADALAYVRKPLSPPGKAWHYSNTNYLLLGLIAEQVTGTPYAELIRSRLLEPTGLGATWVQIGETARTSLAHGYRLPGTKITVKPVDLADGSGVAPFRSVVTAAGAAGSIAATSGDLAAWGRALYSGRVLGPAGTSNLLSGFTKATSYLPGVAYGYGIQSLSIDGHASLGHSGRLLGFRSAVRHFPLDGITIAVLTNQSRADPAVIVRRLLARALPVIRTCALCRGVD
ncbi:MAG: serine hydrolase domain-containing protein [Chloroflexota bacterium]